MGQYRKKPVVIEAVRWTGDNGSLTEILKLDGAHPYADQAHSRVDGRVSQLRSGDLAIETLEGVMTARIGDWIIRGVKGEIYPCKPEVFDATYDLA
jgi:hypothetical protein